MAEYEEPSKITKYQMESQYLEGEVMEEGQEEWLSEGILTDDDYNAPGDHDISGNTSQDETYASTTSVNNSMDKLEQTMDDTVSQEDHNPSQSMNVTEEDTARQDINIEEALNSLENSRNNNQISDDLPDELNAFLIRKTDGKVLTPSVKEDKEDKKSDDGNDTDDLLRMLGDDDTKKKKIKLKERQKKKEEEYSSDDDEYIFKGATKLQRLKVATNALIKTYPPAKAEPEDDDITDCSSDEVATVKSIYRSKPQPQPQPPPPKVLAKPLPTRVGGNSGPVRRVTTVATVTRVPVTSQGRTVVQLAKFSAAPTPPKRPMILKTYQSQRQKALANSPKSLLLSQPPKTYMSQPKPKILNEEFLRDGERNVKTLPIPKPVERKPEPKPEPKPEVKPDPKPEPKIEQKIMKPEQMDEEMPSYSDSDDEDSLYDELPSSDSESAEDWFTIDLRSETAGDYIPLMGDNALQLLSMEKRRVVAKVNALKKNLSSVTTSGKLQAEKLRRATLTLAELDAALGVA